MNENKNTSSRANRQILAPAVIKQRHPNTPSFCIDKMDADALVQGIC
jgi:hypothetical protein